MKMIVKSIAWHVKEPEQNYLHAPCGHKSARKSAVEEKQRMDVFLERQLSSYHTHSGSISVSFLKSSVPL